MGPCRPSRAIIVLFCALEMFAHHADAAHNELHSANFDRMPLQRAVKRSLLAAVPPELVGGNPTCDDLGFDQLIKIEAPVAPGTYGSIQITATTASTISWTTTGSFPSNLVVAAVVMKGGQNGANVYVYSSGTLADAGLVTPNNNNGKPADISHVTFCMKPAPVLQSPPPLASSPPPPAPPEGGLGDGPPIVVGSPPPPVVAPSPPPPVLQSPPPLASSPPPPAPPEGGLGDGPPIVVGSPPPPVVAPSPPPPVLQSPPPLASSPPPPAPPEGGLGDGPPIVVGSPPPPVVAPSPPPPVLQSPPPLASSLPPSPPFPIFSPPTPAFTPQNSAPPVHTSDTFPPSRPVPGPDPDNAPTTPVILSPPSPPSPPSGVNTPDGEVPTSDEVIPQLSPSPPLDPCTARPGYKIPAKCNVEGQMWGDPMFRGFDGSRFEYHGKSKTWHTLLMDGADLDMTTMFIKVPNTRPGTTVASQIRLMHGKDVVRVVMVRLSGKKKRLDVYIGNSAAIRVTKKAFRKKMPGGTGVKCGYHLSPPAYCILETKKINTLVTLNSNNKRPTNGLNVIVTIKSALAGPVQGLLGRTYKKAARSGGAKSAAMKFE